MAELRIANATASALLPPLWRIVQSYGMKVEALMWSELPIFGAPPSTSSFAPAPLTSADMIETTGDPDAAEALRWWYDNRRNAHKTGGIWIWSVVYKAVATSGNMAPLAWGDANNYIDSSFITRAIACGHVDVVKWAVTTGVNVPHDAEVGIARQNNLDLMIWLHNTTGDRTNRVDASAAAAEFGNLEMVKLTLSVRMRALADIMPGVLRGASRSGNTETLEWLGRYAPQTVQKSGAEAVYQATNIFGLTWIIEHTSYNWDGSECDVYAFNGYIELIQYAQARECPWGDTYVGCVRAAQNGHLETLQWMVGNGAVYNPVRCHEAALRGGHTRVVEWTARHISP